MKGAVHCAEITHTGVSRVLNNNIYIIYMRERCAMQYCCVGTGPSVKQHTGQIQTKNRVQPRPSSTISLPPWEYSCSGLFFTVKQDS